MDALDVIHDSAELHGLIVEGEIGKILPLHGEVRRDHDNIEVNMVSDIVAMYVLADDCPSVCSHYYCSAAGEEDRTTVYVVPKQDFPKWLQEENGG